MRMMGNTCDILTLRAREEERARRHTCLLCFQSVGVFHLSSLPHLSLWLRLLFFDEICRKRVNATRMQKAPRRRGGGENGESLLPPRIGKSLLLLLKKTLPLSLPPPLSLYPPPFSERSLCNSISFSGHKRGREGRPLFSSVLLPLLLVHRAGT